MSTLNNDPKFQTGNGEKNTRQKLNRQYIPAYVQKVEE